MCYKSYVNDKFKGSSQHDGQREELLDNGLVRENEIRSDEAKN